jgi:hypothetical protein
MKNLYIEEALKTRILIFFGVWWYVKIMSSFSGTPRKYGMFSASESSRNGFFLQFKIAIYRVRCFSSVSSI